MEALIGNDIHYKVWDEIIYPFQNSNGTTVERDPKIWNVIYIQSQWPFTVVFSYFT